MRLIDLTGQTFGRLTVVGRGPSAPNGRAVRWWCVCECGGVALAQGANLRGGHTTSCGCWMREQMARVGEQSRTHGHSTGRQTPEYRCWVSQ